MINYASFQHAATLEPSLLIAGNADMLRGQQHTIAQGQVLPTGALMGQIAASGQCVLSEADALDGSETPFGILAQDVDTTASASSALLFVRGDFRVGAVSFGLGHSPDSVFSQLRNSGIFLI